MSKTIKEIKDKNKKSADGMIYKSVPVGEFKVDAEKGIIEAYVSIFNNVDLGGDKILPGAFADSLKKKYPKGVWSHNWDQPIAKTLEAKEDEKGLYIKGQFNLDTQRGKDAFSDIKFGIIDEFSIGFRIQEYSWEKEGADEDEIRVIKKIKLYEWSPVLAGMNPETELIGVKADQTKRLIKFVKTDNEKRLVKIYFDDGKTEEIKMSYSYFKYLKSLDNKGVKVEPLKEDVKKILRIRQAIKVAAKANEYVLRITKN